MGSEGIEYIGFPMTEEEVIALRELLQNN